MALNIVQFQPYRRMNIDFHIKTKFNPKTTPDSGKAERELSLRLSKFRSNFQFFIFNLNFIKSLFKTVILF